MSWKQLKALFLKKANKGENSNEQAIKSNIQIWCRSLNTVYILHIFSGGGSEMVVVNIIFLSFMVGFCIKAGTMLIPMVIEEFRNMED